MKTIASALTRSQQQLMSEGSDSARLDAELLLAHVMHCDRGYLFTWPERELSSAQESDLIKMVERRASGVPIAYLTGKKDFWSLALEVNSTTLIPRPETELLVELALQRLPVTSCKMIDLGTGTGAIALALAKERPQWHVTATDQTAEIVDLAKRNAKSAGLEKITFAVSQWLESIAEKDFDLIISNPPYIDAADVHLSQGDLRFEPRSALVSEKNGLADIETISDQARRHLKSGGYLLLEHGFSQGVAVRNILQSAGYVEMETVRDLAGHERVTLGQYVSGEK